MEGTEDAFCCTGCEAAFEIIRGAGLERYYREREAYAPRPEPGARGWDAVPVEEGADGSCAVRLQVDGLRCASCVWVTEHVLQRLPGVREAHVSYATGRATLRWDPTETELASLAGTIQALGYRPRLLGEEARPDRALLVRLGVATFAALNVMLLYASLYAGWFDGMEERFRLLFQWASLALATPVALWAASPFFVGAWSGLRRRFLHMDLPISLAVAVLYVHGAAVTFTGAGEAYLDSLTMLVALLLGGRVLEGHGRRRAAEAATSLAATLPATGRRIGADGGVETVPSGELRVGDRVAMGAGEEFPADGVVVTGRGSVRTALLTGESRPVEVESGQRVYGGTYLVDGALEVQVTAVGEESTVTRMAQGLRDAADRGGSPTSADRIAPWFTAATLVAATATFLGWGLAAGWGEALTATVAVLVVACPCALALSHPLAAAAGLGAAARRGLLLRSPDPLLALAEVDTAALDKTGTVTEGALDVLEAEDDTLRIAAGLERFSRHPVALAIVREAVRREIPLPRARNVREEAGTGIRGEVDGVVWALGAGGAGEVVLTGPDGAQARIRLGDQVRADAASAVQELQGMGIRVLLLTGDHREVAERVAAATGISDWAAEMKPEAKAARLQQEEAAGARVLFAGDGLNDGPALAQAYVGVAMGTGAASSILVADGVVGAPSLSPLVGGIRAGRAARRVIRTNQVRSIAYNVVAVALASVGWVNPLVAAILMPLSSGLVIAGAAGVEGRVRRMEARATGGPAVDVVPKRGPGGTGADREAHAGHDRAAVEAA
ncbi:MAG TPA: heavy metal translocating P-type ATPase metal-binding domain-containing protein [Longimicrobiales bacterium]|nr:heavy metal translocating P-type ATPase metal-binding domain-containing protein [Longimicrobiales bacterium]